MTDYELLSLNSDYFILREDQSQMMVLTGRNFNQSHDYRVVIQSIEVDRYRWDI